MDSAIESELWDSRTRTLLGDDAMRRLSEAHVLVAGLGGVGGYAAEMLARSGIGRLTLVDADRVAPSNLNRQIIALRSTIGQPKTALFGRRFADINPDLKLNLRQEFITPENVDSFLDEPLDFVIDAIDTVAPKVALIARTMERKIPVVSSMGAGGRIDPSAVKYADLWTTRDDGLAKAVRQRLKKMGLRRPLKVVCSTEPPRRKSLIEEEEKENKRTSFGTIAAIPSLFGIFIAQYVIIQISQAKSEV